MPRAHILVIEDDRAIREGLAACLELADFTVSQAVDVPSGRRAALGLDADLILLDLVMPGGDGLDILAALRQARPALPVIILTARGAEQDRVKGLKGGADDYVVKPFGAEELLARVEAVLRRAGAKAAPTGGRIAVPGATVDLAKRTVHRDDGATEDLSEQEADLVRLLAERRDRAVPREELLSLLWRTSAPDLGSRAVDMLVARVRAKLGDSGREARALVTVRGCGYRLVVEG
jgi:DNA-binding response OmpR family regulator